MSSGRPPPSPSTAASSNLMSGGGALSWLSAPFVAVGDLLFSSPQQPTQPATAAATPTARQAEQGRTHTVAARPFHQQPVASSHAKHPFFPRRAAGVTGSGSSVGAVPGGARPVGPHPGMPVEVGSRRGHSHRDAPAEEEELSHPPASAASHATAAASDIAAASSSASSSDAVAELAPPPKSHVLHSHPRHHLHTSSFDGLSAEQDAFRAAAHQRHHSFDPTAASPLSDIAQTPTRASSSLHSSSTFATPLSVAGGTGASRSAPRPRLHHPPPSSSLSTSARESDALEDEESAARRTQQPRKPRALWDAQGELAHAASSPALSAAAAHSPAAAATAGASTTLPQAEQLQSSYPFTPSTPAHTAVEQRPPMHGGQPQLTSQPRLQTESSFAAAASSTAAQQQSRAVSAPGQSMGAGTSASSRQRQLPPSVPDLSSYSSANMEEAEAAAAAAAEKAAAARAAAEAAAATGRQASPDLSLQLLPQLFGFGRKLALDGFAGNSNSSNSNSASSDQFDPSVPLSPVAPARNVKLLNFQRLLSEPNIDLAQLRRLSWSGVPAPVRSVVWKLLLGYLPVSLARREAALAKRRAEYATYLADFFYCGLSAEDYYARERGSNISAAAGDGSVTQQHPPLHRSEQEQEVLKQIKQDVPRTSPGVSFFKLPPVQASLERVLYAFAVRHPASGYVQGMNDLVTPFYAAGMREHFGVDILMNGPDEAAVAAEAQRALEAVQDPVALGLLEGDCYWCLSLLLDSIQDHYTFAQPGIQRMVFKLEELVQRIDGNGNTPGAGGGSATNTPSKAHPTAVAAVSANHVGLAAHLARENVQFLHFGFRWMTVLLMRELRLSLILRLWDSYLAEDGSNGSSSSASSSAGGSGVVVGGGVGSGFRQLHVYVCAAFLLRWSRELKRMDFQQLVTFLQRLPTDEWSEADVESLLAQAHIYRTIYSPQHLA